MRGVPVALLFFALLGLPAASARDLSSSGDQLDVYVCIDGEASKPNVKISETDCASGTMDTASVSILVDAGSVMRQITVHFKDCTSGRCAAHVDGSMRMAHTPAAVQTNTAFIDTWLDAVLERFTPLRVVEVPAVPFL